MCKTACLMLEFVILWIPLLCFANTLSLTPVAILVTDVQYIPDYIRADVPQLKPTIVDRKILGELKRYKGSHYVKYPYEMREDFDVDANGVIYIANLDGCVYMISPFYLENNKMKNLKWEVEGFDWVKVKRSDLEWVHRESIKAVRIGPDGKIYVKGGTADRIAVFSPKRELLHIFATLWPDEIVVSKNGTIYAVERNEIPPADSCMVVHYNKVNVLDIPEIYHGNYYCDYRCYDLVSLKEDESAKGSKKSWLELASDEEGKVYMLKQTIDVPDEHWSLWVEKERGKFEKVVEKTMHKYYRIIICFDVSSDGYMYAVLEKAAESGVGFDHYIAKISLKDLSIKGMYDISDHHPDNRPEQIRVRDLKGERYIYVLDWPYPRLIVFKEKEN
ncbi:MAG: hypothetical protein J7L52_01665 [Thermotogae bacterium]|nr:hypothetical protein [Thermotogota bacterium]